MANIETLLADTRYFAEAAAPSTPASGSGVMYFKTDGKPYAKNDAGTEYDMSGTGVGGTTSNFPCQGRLTLTTAVPITTADVTAATSLYFTPYKGNQIATYSGAAWTLSTFTEKSITLAGLTADLPYDVFIVDSTLALELTAWTNATARATALVTQDGVLCKTGALTRRYLGTICITNTTGQCEDSVLKRLVWNYYNRVERRFRVVDTTDSWTYGTAAWRSWNNSTANRVTFVVGVSEDPVALRFAGAAKNSAGGNLGLGIALDATNTSSADYYAAFGGGTVITQTVAEYNNYPGIGSHFLQLTEYGVVAGTTTFYGDFGLVFMQCGAAGYIRA